LQTGSVTFGCLNNFCKINEPVLRLWARVLAHTDRARLVMLTVPGSHRQRTLAFLHEQGIAPERVQLAAPQSRHKYLELYHHIDIALDTFPYNGHTTSLDALWMGVPVITLPGERPVSRAGLSQLTNLGLPELIAQSDDDYLSLAVQLSRDLPRL